MQTSIIFAIVAIVAALVLFVVISYVKTSPAVAYIVSGLSKKPKVLIGTGGFRIPFFQKLDKIYLGQITVDVRTNTPVPTSDFIDVMIDSVAKVRILPTPEGIQLASANFLNMSSDQIAAQVQDVLQGNMREIVGTLDLRSLNTDRDGFSKQIAEKAKVDMEALGIEILACNIQNITDKQGLIQALGADNVYKIKKDASINKAQAEKDVAIAEAQAKKEANDARVLAETEIAERNNELVIKQAELKKESDIKRAESDAAYEIQKQEQMKVVNVKTVEAEAAKKQTAAEKQKAINTATVEAEIEKAARIAELEERNIAIRERQLSAEVNKQADAAKYEREVQAAAELEQRKRKAEAETYEAEQRAKAKRAEAEALKYAMEQEAAGIEAKGKAEAVAIQAKLTAEAEGIKAKGEAEAKAMDKKAEAFKKYNAAAMASMVVEVLPAVAKSVAEPLSAIKDVHVYGTTGEEASGMSGNVPVLIKKTFDVVKQTTGTDLSTILENGSAVAADVTVEK